MPDILHRVGMRTSAAKVYEALATTEGLSHWWMTDTTGETAGFDMKVIASRPDVVEWECVGGPSEWLGTRVTFRLKAKGDEFTAPVSDEGFGLLTSLKLPGGGELGLYEPRHPIPHA